MLGFLEEPNFRKMGCIRIGRPTGKDKTTDLMKMLPHSNLDMVLRATNVALVGDKTCDLIDNNSVTAHVEVVARGGVGGTMTVRPFVHLAVAGKGLELLQNYMLSEFTTKVSSEQFAEIVETVVRHGHTKPVDVVALEEEGDGPVDGNCPHTRVGNAEPTFPPSRLARGARGIGGNESVKAGSMFDGKPCRGEGFRVEGIEVGDAAVCGVGVNGGETGQAFVDALWDGLEALARVSAVTVKVEQLLVGVEVNPEQEGPSTRPVKGDVEVWKLRRVPHGDRWGVAHNLRAVLGREGVPDLGGEDEFVVLNDGVDGGLEVDVTTDPIADTLSGAAAGAVASA